MNTYQAKQLKHHPEGRIMNTSNIFKRAHELTRKTIKTGDSYSATFAICLKTVYKMAANAITSSDFRRLRATSKTAKNGAQVLEILVGSDADALLVDDYHFATFIGRSDKIGNGYIVTGRGETFTKGGDWRNEYQYVYIIKN